MPALLSLPHDRVLGIDVGGSGTRAALAQGGSVIEEWQLPGGNLVLDPAAVTERVRALCADARPARVAVGVAGLRTADPLDVERMTGALEAVAPDGVRIASDAVVAHLGALGGGRGIVVCAGTGAIAVAGEPSALAYVGGHGHLVDDRGSAYWIGAAGLRAALRALDRGYESQLAAELAAAAGGDAAIERTLRALVRAAHAAPQDRAILASLAPVVTASEDADARAVVADAAAALADLAELAVERWGAMPVTFAGGVFTCAAIRDELVRRTGAVEPLAPPHVGALLALAP